MTDKHVQPDDSLTVAQATAGMGPEQKDAWLNRQKAQVLKDAADEGLHFRQKVGIARFEAGDDFLTADPDSHDISVNEIAARTMTVRQVKALLAHEIRHTNQSRGLTDDDRAYAEKDADRWGARIYGPKTYNDALEKLNSVHTFQAGPNEPVPNPYVSDGEDPHGSIRHRQYEVNAYNPPDDPIIPTVATPSQETGPLTIHSRRSQRHQGDKPHSARSLGDQKPPMDRSRTVPTYGDASGAAQMATNAVGDMQDYKAYREQHASLKTESSGLQNATPSAAEPQPNKSTQGAPSVGSLAVAGDSAGIRSPRAFRPG